VAVLLSTVALRYYNSVQRVASVPEIMDTHSFLMLLIVSQLVGKGSDPGEIYVGFMVNKVALRHISILALRNSLANYHFSSVTS
jgi:hypothetical protein